LFRAALKVTTRDSGDGVEVRVCGTIASASRRKKRDRLKPTGEGTGLGLSISYEIVTQQHGGTITVGSELVDWAEFTVRLLRRHETDLRRCPLSGR
jgi:signal transduction histidine kinase